MTGLASVCLQQEQTTHFSRIFRRALAVSLLVPWVRPESLYLSCDTQCDNESKIPVVVPPATLEGMKFEKSFKPEMPCHSLHLKAGSMVEVLIDLSVASAGMVLEVMHCCESTIMCKIAKLHFESPQISIPRALFCTNTPTSLLLRLQFPLRVIQPHSVSFEEVVATGASSFSLGPLCCHLSLRDIGAFRQISKSFASRGKQGWAEPVYDAWSTGGRPMNNNTWALQLTFVHPKATMKALPTALQRLPPCGRRAVQFAIFRDIIHHALWREGLGFHGTWFVLGSFALQQQLRANGAKIRWRANDVDFWDNGPGVIEDLGPDDEMDYLATFCLKVAHFMVDVLIRHGMVLTLAFNIKLYDGNQTTNEMSFRRWVCLQMLKHKDRPMLGQALMETLTLQTAFAHVGLPDASRLNHYAHNLFIDLRIPEPFHVANLAVPKTLSFISNYSSLTWQEAASLFDINVCQCRFKIDGSGVGVVETFNENVASAIANRTFGPGSPGGVIRSSRARKHAARGFTPEWGGQLSSDSGNDTNSDLELD